MAGSVFRRTRKSGHTSWWIDVTIAGRRIREPAGSTKAAAEERLTALLRAHHERVYLPSRKKAELTLGALRDRWLVHARSKRTIQGDAALFRRMLTFLGERTLVADLTAADVERFVAWLDGRGRSVATSNRYLSLLRAALRLARREGYLAPVEIRLRREHNARDRDLAPGEYEALLGACQGDPRMRAMVTILARTGLRLGELAGLRWSDVSMTDRLIRLGSGPPLP